MLIEMWSPAFIENGKVREMIAFKDGLNVLLGKEDGENSIGKSFAMLAIDFVFGGNTYIDSDGVKYIGYHTIFLHLSLMDKNITLLEILQVQVSSTIVQKIMS